MIEILEGDICDIVYANLKALIVEESKLKLGSNQTI